MAERLGLDWDPRQEDEVAVPSLTLGTIGVHMLDLAGAYGGIANGGEFVPPYLIERIEDSEGNVIYDHADCDDAEQVLSARPRYLVTDILADNTDPAANPLWGPRFQLQTEDGTRRPATLKTGTTNDFKDLQAVGYLAGNPDDPDDPTGAIVTGVWVGNSDFSAIQDVFAADGPTFIWHDYMAEVAALNELPLYDFARPDGVTEMEVDAISGLLPGELTTTRVTEVFRADRPPAGQDTLHRELRIEAETGKIWQEGCGDFEAVEPSGAPDPSAAPAPPERASRSSSTSPAGRTTIRPGRRRTSPGSRTGPAASRSSMPRCACRSPDRRRAAGADRGLHARRDPDLDAVARRRRHRPPRRRRPRPATPAPTPDAAALRRRRNRRRPRRRARPRARRPSPRRRPRPFARHGSPARAGARASASRTARRSAPVPMPCTITTSSSPASSASSR